MEKDFNFNEANLKKLFKISFQFFLIVGKTEKSPRQKHGGSSDAEET